MRLIGSIILLFIAKSSISQVDTLFLKGELEYDVVQSVECGVALIAVKGKIRIEEYSDLTYGKNQIVVIFLCPNDTDFDQLLKGSTYNFILSKNNTTPYGEPIESFMTLDEFEIIKEFNEGDIVWAINWERQIPITPNKQKRKNDYTY